MTHLRASGRPQTLARRHVRFITGVGRLRGRPHIKPCAEIITKPKSLAICLALESMHVGDLSALLPRTPAVK